MTALYRNPCYNEYITKGLHCDNIIFLMTVLLQLQHTLSRRPNGSTKCSKYSYEYNS